jgi:hypothetical protein
MGDDGHVSLFHSRDLSAILSVPRCHVCALYALSKS